MEVQGYPNYLIYEDGRVYSKKYKKLLKPSIIKGGYNRVVLYNKNGSKPYLVHRLVGFNYITNPNNYPQIDHIDRDTNNNNISNLRWVSSRENCSNRRMKEKEIKIRKNNTSGFIHISYIHSRNCYSVNIKHKRKNFKILEEAIEYRNKLIDC